MGCKGLFADLGARLGPLSLPILIWLHALAWLQGCCQGGPPLVPGGRHAFWQL